MLRFLLFLLGLALVLIGVLAGGCSLLFTPGLFGTGEFEGSGMFPIWAAGMVTGALGLWLGIWAIRAVMRAGDARTNTAADATTPDQSPENRPDDPPPNT